MTDENEMKKRVLKLLLQGKMPSPEDLDQAVLDEMKVQAAKESEAEQQRPEAEDSQ